MNTKFEVGAEYGFGLWRDSSCKFRAKILKRTAKTATISITSWGEPEVIKVKIYPEICRVTGEESEMIAPYGLNSGYSPMVSYSIAQVHPMDKIYYPPTDEPTAK
jgi:hypothetical protein